MRTHERRSSRAREHPTSPPASVEFIPEGSVAATCDHRVVALRISLSTHGNQHMASTPQYKRQSANGTAVGERNASQLMAHGMCWHLLSSHRTVSTHRVMDLLSKFGFVSSSLLGRVRKVLSACQLAVLLVASTSHLFGSTSTLSVGLSRWAVEAGCWFGKMHPVAL